MEYRKFENLGVSPSLLGFGCMRFPQTPDGNIDEAEAERMLDRALQAGVTYIDTAYPYHNGDSEPFVGKVLKKYDRSSFYLATKLPVWNVKTIDDAKRIFQEQLDRLEVDYVDFYLLHCLDKEKWQTVLDLGIIPYMEEMKKEGKIKFFGFSFHDDFETFKTIATYRKWDFCQIQYNYVDTDIQAGDKGYELTKELGIPLVIMEPVKGGSLATLPDAVTEPFKDYKPNSSISSWALRWVASKSNVKVVLSGMTTMEQVEDNLNTFENFTPLNLKEKEIVADVASAIKQRAVPDARTVCHVPSASTYRRISASGTICPCMKIKSRLNAPTLMIWKRMPALTIARNAANARKSVPRPCPSGMIWNV